MHWCSFLSYVTQTQLYSSYDFTGGETLQTAKSKCSVSEFILTIKRGHATEKLLELTILGVIFTNTSNKMHGDLFNVKQNIVAESIKDI